MSGSKGRSQQQQTSSSESESSGKSSSSGSVASGGQDQATSFQDQAVDEQQQPFLDFLRSQGQQLAGQQLGGGGQFQQDILNPTVAAFNQQIQGDPQLLQQQIAQRQFGVTENLQENLLPSIGGQAQAAGAVGGSRQGVAEGIALRDASRQQQNIATDLTGQAQQRQLAALGLAPSVGNLGFQPLQNFGGIVGGPTVLGQAGAQSTGSRFSEAQTVSEGIQNARGSGIGQGTGSSKSFGLGF